ncbi:glycosyltransferase family 2 protein [Pelagibacterium sp. 26DY04]|uniref:glycosyltransferase family 2 protein n=1 Tax=Pelagibacterium sp. 26DY04 TaxID=2967130 RepID=UPI00281603F5|nr:glycosyltransferase family 2 protein [Pelagibacterium sp. 26DY04]WMT87941.1 glycosyltransferase family 2 protein [Pelagibacterium sp. 26DY04]
MEKISVVICTHSTSRLPLVRDALASVQIQTRPAHEIIVVVDHNQTVADALASDDTNVRVIPNTGPQGLSSARNCGVAAATGDIIAFIDDDARAAPDWLEKLLEIYRTRDVLAVGGYIEPVWPGGRPSWWPEEFDWVVGCSYRGQPETAASVRNLIGCNMSFRRMAFDVCGGFSETLGRVGADGGGCEETELCIRAQSAFPLSRILYDPAVRVRHRIDPERVSWRYFVKRCRAEGRSKALLAARLGGGQGLKTETRYVRRVLPAGVLKGLAGGWDGFLRAGAIIAGFAITATAYALPRRTRSKAEAEAPPFAPIKVAQFDLAEPIGELASDDPGNGRIYGGAFCLVREHDRPLGIAKFATHGRPVEAREFSVLLQQARAGDEAAVRPAKVLSQPPTARVVVATRDRPGMLVRCLDSLLVQAYRQFEIHVVDSAPASSATRELIAQRYAGTNICYRHEANPGLGLAHNRGIAGARAEILAFTDDDVLVDRNWLAVIGNAFARDARIGCVTGLILPAELETRAQWWTEAHGGFNKGFTPRLFDLEFNRPKGSLFPYAPGAFGSGANMAFSRAALDAIGGFDPALGAGTLARGGDDLAAFTATILAGFQLAYEPGAIVWHHHRRTEEGIAGQAYGYGVGLGAYLTKTLFDHPSSALAYALGLPAALVHILGPGSSKNARLPSDYPSALKWAERRGMVAGFAAYFRSRRAVARRAGRERQPPLMSQRSA